MKEPLRIYIVEDMAITRLFLEDKLAGNGFRVAGSSSKAEYAWMDIQDKLVDLVLIDINLAGEKDGIWLAKKIRQHMSMPIVYLTAFGDPKTIDQVIETRPNGYLMKPYNVPSLLTTISIAIENFSKQHHSENDEEHSPDTVFIKDSNIMVKLKTNDILYVQSDGNYIHIYQENKKHTIRSKLSDFSDKLPPENFLQVHQRYIVNLNYIDLVGSDHVMIKGVDVPVSRKYKKDLFKNIKT